MRSAMIERLEDEVASAVRAMQTALDYSPADFLAEPEEQA